MRISITTKHETTTDFKVPGTWVYIQYTFALITQSPSTNVLVACYHEYKALGIMNKKTDEIVEKLPKIIQGIAECN